MMLRILTALACLVVGTAAHASYEEGLRLKQAQRLPEATAAFSEAVAREPGNVLALEQLAVVLGWQQRFAESIATWQRAIALAPGKADYHVGLARVQYWSGAREAALASLDRALHADPASAEAHALRGDVLLAEARPDEARASYTRAQALDPTNAELATKLARTTPPLLWRLDAGATYDRFTNERGSENSRFVQLGRRVGAGGDVVYARYEGFRSFGATDRAAVLGGYWLPHPQVLVQVEAGTALDAADFRPETLAMVNGEWLLPGPVQPLFGIRALQYDVGDVRVLTPGLRVLAGPATAEARYGFTNNVDGSDTGILSLRLGLAQGRYAPYLAYTSGEEALPPLEKASLIIYGAGLVVDVDPRWALRVDYSHEDRQPLFTHRSIGSALTYRF